MRKVFLIIILVVSLLSCQEEVFKPTQKWIGDVNLQIESISDNFNLIKEKIIEDDQLVEKIQLYQNSDGNCAKYILSLEMSIDIEIVEKIYLIDNQVVLYELRGYLPYIDKGQREKGDSLGKLTDKKIYFQGSEFAIEYSKEIDIISMDFLNFERRKLTKLNYIENPLSDSEEVYNRILERVNHSKELLKN